MITVPIPAIYTFEILDKKQEKNLENQQFPIVPETAALLFRPTMGSNLYVIETLDDILSIQQKIKNDALAGEWGVSIDKVFKKKPNLSSTETSLETTVLITPHQQASLQKRNRDLIKIILRRSMPIAGNQLIDMLGNLTTSWILARINPATLASGVFINASQLMTVAILSSGLNSIAALVPKANASNRKEDVGIIMQQSWLLGAINSVPPMIILFNIERILVALGQSPILAKITQSYFNPYIWSIPASMWLYADMQFAYAIKKSHIAVLVNIIGTIIASATSYILAHGKLGVPVLKAAGVGFAWLIQAWVSLLLFKLALFYYRKDLSEFGLLQFHPTKKWATLRELLRIGAPIMGQTAGDLLSFFVTALMVGRLGVAALSAFEILSQYLLLVAIPISSISLSSCLLVNDAYGLQDYAAMKKYGYLSMALISGLMSTVFIVFALLPKQLASVYINVNDSKNAEVLAYLEYLFMLVGAGQIFNGIREVAGNSLRGILDNTVPMIYRLLTTWGIAVALGYALAFPLDVGIYGLTAVGDLSALVCAGLLLKRWWSKTEVIANIALDDNTSCQNNYFFRSCKKVTTGCITYLNNHLNHNAYSKIEDQPEESNSICTKFFNVIRNVNVFKRSRVETPSASAISKIESQPEENNSICTKFFNVIRNVNIFKRSRVETPSASTMHFVPS